MKSIRPLAHLLDAVFIVALLLLLSVLTLTKSAGADETVSPSPPITLCAECVAPTNLPCAGGPPAFCGIFAPCPSCRCVADPVIPGTAACI